MAGHGNHPCAISVATPASARSRRPSAISKTLSYWPRIRVGKTLVTLNSFTHAYARGKCTQTSPMVESLRRMMISWTHETAQQNVENRPIDVDSR